MNDLNHHTRISQGDSEISLSNILHHLIKAWKMVVIAVLVGLALSITYLAITPKQYEAVSQIIVAQIGAANSSISPVGINIEEPSFLIARMSMPTSFTTQAIEVCGFQNKAEAATILSKSIKLRIIKDVSNLVELKTFGSSPQAAERCNSAIFELIKITQSQSAVQYIADIKSKLDDDVERLTRAREFLSKADKSGTAMNAAYISTRDEIGFLLNEITALKNVIGTNDNRITRLVAPVYASEIPVSPMKRNVLAYGLFGGLLLALLIVMARIMISSLKGKTGSP